MLVPLWESGLQPFLVHLLWKMMVYGEDGGEVQMYVPAHSFIFFPLYQYWLSPPLVNLVSMTSPLATGPWHLIPIVSMSALLLHHTSAHHPPPLLPLSSEPIFFLHQRSSGWGNSSIGYGLDIIHQSATKPFLGIQPTASCAASSLSWSNPPGTFSASWHTQIIIVSLTRIICLTILKDLNEHSFASFLMHVLVHRSISDSSCFNDSTWPCSTGSGRCTNHHHYYSCLRTAFTHISYSFRLHLLRLLCHFVLPSRSRKQSGS